MMEYRSDVALIVVDVQNDFSDRAGSLYVPGGQDVVGACNREIERARSAGSPVLYTQDWHPARTPHFQIDGGIWPVHCVAGSWGAQFHADLLVQGAVIRKGSNGEDGYSGFSMRDPVSGLARPTELEELLKKMGIASLVVAGLAGDYCVGATAKDGRARGYRVAVLEAAVAFVEMNRGDTVRTWAELAELGIARA